jgi:tetratricopeptide (TPR) repeat protein
VLIASFVCQPQSWAQNSVERPWARGVSETAQKRAFELLQEGNTALQASQWRTAAARYREALRFWDHPGINYNLALALTQLSEPIETLQRLDSALRYGPPALEAEKFEHAQRLKALTEKQVATVEVVCALEGAVVKVNGEQAFVGPGTHRAVVRPGRMTIVAFKEGYLTHEESPLLLGGERKKIEVTLARAEQAIEYRRLFAPWIPWVVLGTGAVLAIVGSGVHNAARERFVAYDDRIERCADTRTGGCVPDLEVATLKNEGDGFQRGALTLYGVGAAALVTGAILLYANRLQPYRANLKLESHFVIPSVWPNGLGVSVLWGTPP